MKFIDPDTGALVDDDEVDKHTLGYLPWKPDPRPSTRPRDFFHETHQTSRSQAFLWLLAAKGRGQRGCRHNQHAAQVANFDGGCGSRFEQRRWAAQRKGGATELVLELFAAPCSNISNGRCSHFSLERVWFPPLLTCPKPHSAHSTGVLHRLRDFPRTAKPSWTRFPSRLRRLR